ncbi:MAG: response regulator [Proteobacteria bacterium]|nr:response regulator [Pseudomonadota bacterium]
MRILCVDDSRAIHAYMDSVLAGTEFQLVHVYNGQEALMRLEEPDSSLFEAVLMDWEMPIMDGPSTVEAIRKSGNKIPIIMVTTKNEFADIALMLGKGASDYMMKPFTKDILVEKLESVTERKGA